MTDDGPVCMLCGSRESERYPPKYMNGNLWRCLDCDLRFVYPQPSLEELTDVYSEDYFSSSNSNELGYSDYEGDRSNIYRTFKRRLNYLQQVHPGNGSVLDVGCAYGFFLEVAAEAGWDVSGVDISTHAVERARERLGDRVQAGTFSEEELPEQRFSVITMWDYLEHVVDPKADLAKAWRLLADDGILALATPDVSSMPAKVFGHRWMGYKLDEHLVYFSRATMRRFLEESGFKVINMKHEGKFISLRMFLQRLSLYAPFITPLVNMLLKVGAVPPISFYANSRDILLVLAQKTNPADA